jgi:hypothetical protein
MKTIIKIYWAILLVAGILISSTTNAQNCGVPGGLNVTVVSATSMQLNWNAVPGAIRYDLEIQNATGNPVPFLLKPNATTTTYTLSGITLPPIINLKCVPVAMAISLPGHPIISLPADQDKHNVRFQPDYQPEPPLQPLPLFHGLQVQVH